MSIVSAWTDVFVVSSYEDGTRWRSTGYLYYERGGRRAGKFSAWNRMTDMLSEPGGRLSQHRIARSLVGLRGWSTGDHDPETGKSRFFTGMCVLAGWLCTRKIEARLLDGLLLHLAFPHEEVSPLFCDRVLAEMGHLAWQLDEGPRTIDVGAAPRRFFYR
jgi:hypothetical protein